MGDIFPIQFIQLEALVVGFLSIAIEVQIWFTLSTQGRILHYYHIIPMWGGFTLMLSGTRPLNLYFNAVSLGFTLSTIFNIYNTYFVHVVMLRNFVESNQENEKLIEDLFLPKYKSGFYPWGSILQQCWATLVSFHLTLRIISFVDLLTKIQH